MTRSHRRHRCGHCMTRSVPPTRRRSTRRRTSRSATLPMQRMHLGRPRRRLRWPSAQRSCSRPTQTARCALGHSSAVAERHCRRRRATEFRTWGRLHIRPLLSSDCALFAHAAGPFSRSPSSLTAGFASTIARAASCARQCAECRAVRHTRASASLDASSSTDGLGLSRSSKS